MGSLQELTFALSNGTIPDLLRPPLPQDQGFAPHQKLQSLLSQEREKLRTSNLARTITGSIRIKAHEKFWRKGSVGVSIDCPIYSGTPYYLRNGKSYEIQILRAHLQAQSEQKPVKILGKSSRGRSQSGRDSRQFSGHPYTYGASHGDLCDSSAFLQLHLIASLTFLPKCFRAALKLYVHHRCLLLPYPARKRLRFYHPMVN